MLTRWLALDERIAAFDDRARDRAVGERTSLMNQLRAVLLERGFIVPQGRAKLRLRVTELLSSRQLR
jgi:hypothetical protein